MNENGMEARRMAIGFQNVAKDRKKREHVADSIHAALRQLANARDSISKMTSPTNGTAIVALPASRSFKKPPNAEPIESAKAMPADCEPVYDLKDGEGDSDMVGCLLEALSAALSNGKLPELQSVATPIPKSAEQDDFESIDDLLAGALIEGAEPVQAASEESEELVTIGMCCPGCEKFMPIDSESCPHCGEAIGEGPSSFEINYPEISEALSSSPLESETLFLVNQVIGAIREMNALDEESAMITARFTNVALAKGAENAPEMDRVLAMEIAIDAIAEINIECSEPSPLFELLSGEHLDFWAEAALAVLYQAEVAREREKSIFYFLLGTNSIDFNSVMMLKDDAPSLEVRAMALEVWEFETGAEEIYRRNARRNFYGSSVPSSDLGESKEVLEEPTAAPEPIRNSAERAEPLDLADKTRNDITAAVLSFMSKGTSGKRE